MSIFLIKAGIRSLIQSEIFIDEFDVKTPINLPKVIDGVYYPSVAAVEAPVSGLQTTYEETRKVNSTATFRVDIAWRFNHKAEYHELPLRLIENLLEWVNYKAVSQPGTIWEYIYSLDVDNTAYPVMVSRAEDGDQDWLIYGIFEWVIGFPSLPLDPNELGIIQPDINRSEGVIITSIGIKTHKKLPPDDILDKEILID